MSDEDDTNDSPPAKAPYTRWYKGMPQSPNPKGRGHSPSKFSRRVVEELARHFHEKGYAAIDKVYEESPSTYLKIIVSILPKELLLQVARPMTEMSDADLQQAAAAEQEASQKIIEHVRLRGGAALIDQARRELTGETEDDDEDKDGD